MASKLPDETYTANRYYISRGDEKKGIFAGEKEFAGTQKIPVNHYRRLKRLLVKGGTQAVKIYYDKHKAA